MTLIYVAGPYRAPTPHLVAVNVERAAEVARALLYEHGYAVVCPHSMSHRWERDPLYTDEMTLAGCLEMVRRCDALLMLPGWETSAGSLMERAAAQRLDIPVYYSVDELQRAYPPE